MVWSRNMLSLVLGTCKNHCAMKRVPKVVGKDSIKVTVHVEALIRYWRCVRNLNLVCLTEKCM